MDVGSPPSTLPGNMMAFRSHRHTLHMALCVRRTAYVVQRRSPISIVVALVWVGTLTGASNSTNSTNSTDTTNDNNVGAATIVAPRPPVPRPPLSIDVDTISTTFAPSSSTSSSMNLTIGMLSTVVVLAAIAVFFALFKRRQDDFDDDGPITTTMTKTQWLGMQAFDTIHIARHDRRVIAQQSPHGIILDTNDRRSPAVVLGELGNPEETADRILDGVWTESGRVYHVAPDDAIRVSTTSTGRAYYI
ncbi:Aste57867_24033 [Aphanomyces stellatus]|uniref:Aste57867_24033 protein n=1 Tax=Aphanomyces stellatus TaxID=120398 RepID=A0A485LPC9_9STRA|nr:hypothetical protein As57867_023960 [Aphanomyces stellatus]VFU00676.1 Aste57867_24033 [Aphanomyces stellatus]